MTSAFTPKDGHRWVDSLLKNGDVDTDAMRHRQNNDLEQTLTALARTLGSDPNANIASIAGSLVLTVADRHPMFPEEYAALIKKLDIVSQYILNPFIESMKKKDDPETLEDEMQKALARQELLEFLRDGFGGEKQEKLSDFLENLRLSYQEIQVGKLLEEDEIRNRLAEDIKASLLEVASPVLLGKIKEPRFILDYFFSRVLILNGSSYRIDREKLQELVDKLDAAGYRLENLYTLLETGLEQVASVRSQTRSALRRALSDEAEARLKILDFERDPRTYRKPEYDKLFWNHVVPAIEDCRRRKLPDQIRLLDLWLLCDNLNRSILPDEAFEPLREILDLSDAGFKGYLRHHFDYAGWPDIDINISDAQIAALLRCQVKNAQLYPMVNEQTVLGAVADGPQKNNHRSYPEIHGCHEIRKLWEYTAYPERFFDEYPNYGFESERDEVRRKIQMAAVRQQAMGVVLNFVRRRKFHAARRLPDDASAKFNLESYLRYCYGIEDDPTTPEIEISYRTRIRVQPGQSPSDALRDYRDGKYRIELAGKAESISGPEDVIAGPQDFSSAFHSDEILSRDSQIPNNLRSRVYHDQQLLEVEPQKYVYYSNGKDEKFILFPITRLKLKKATMRPRGMDGRQNGGYPIFYSPSKELGLVHEKHPVRIDSGMTREKTIFDLRRLTIIPLTQDGYFALAEAVYDHNTGALPGKIEDLYEKRRFSVEGRERASDSKFSSRPLIGGFAAIRPNVMTKLGYVVDDDGNVIDQEGDRRASLDEFGNFSVPGQSSPVSREDRGSKTYGGELIEFEGQYDTVLNVLLAQGIGTRLSHETYEQTREINVRQGKILPTYIAGSRIPRTSGELPEVHFAGVIEE